MLTTYNLRRAPNPVHPAPRTLQPNPCACTLQSLPWTLIHAFNTRTNCGNYRQISHSLVTVLIWRYHNQFPFTLPPLLQELEQQNLFLACLTRTDGGAVIGIATPWWWCWKEDITIHICFNCRRCFKCSTVTTVPPLSHPHWWRCIYVYGIYRYIYVCICMYACMYVCMYVCVRIYM